MDGVAVAWEGCRGGNAPTGRFTVIISAKRLAAMVLYAVALSILLLLGAWQLLRGQEKAQIESRLADDGGPQEISARPQDWADLDYRRANLSGNWLPDREFLLENRIRQGVPGFEVLTPFELAGDRAVLLVNRGWIGIGADTGGVAPGDGPGGVLYRPEPGFTLGSTLSGEPRWPQTVLYLDIAALSERLGRRLEPAVLVLDPSHPAAHPRLWQPTTLSADRHYGYALQWWGLALALLILGLIWYRGPKTGQS